MDRGRLSEADQLTLLAELEVAMQRMFETSGSADMVALFLKDTARIRGEFLTADGARPAPSLSDRLRRMSRPMRSKYGAMAVWRVSVLWHGVRDELDPDFARAMDVIYFTPYFEDDRPYCWSKRSSRAPGAEQFESPSEVDRWASEGCWQSVQRLRAVVDELGDTAVSIRDEAVAALTKRGVRRTLRDVLRLEEQWTNHANR